MRNDFHITGKLLSYVLQSLLDLPTGFFVSVSVVERVPEVYITGYPRLLWKRIVYGACRFSGVLWNSFP
jgi:hypothetical protein